MLAPALQEALSSFLSSLKGSSTTSEVVVEDVDKAHQTNESSAKAAREVMKILAKGSAC